MTNSTITPVEWKEIEGYLLERPQCKIDETGVIWFQVDDVIRGGMHPRMFLDICRDENKESVRARCGNQSHTRSEFQK